MKKYTLTMGGLGLRATGHSLKDSEVSILKEYQKKTKTTDLYDISQDLEGLLKFDLENANMFVIDKVTNNDRLTFTVEDSTSFKLKDVKIDSKDRVINAKPIKSLVENILLWFEESDESIFEFEFESPTKPKPSDFTVVKGKISVTDGDWSFIDKVMFKGKELTPKRTTENVVVNSLTVELW
jgi:hypothetical protein